MLNDSNFKILKYYNDSKSVFNDVGIAGGVVVSFYDRNKTYEPVKIFTSHDKLNSILRKVLDIQHDNLFLDSIIYVQNKFNLQVLNNDFPLLHREDKRLESNIFNIEAFTSEKVSNDDIKILGLSGTERVYRYISSKYIDKSSKNLFKYKVALPKSYGTGIVHEGEAVSMIGKPLLLEPNVGYTRTFIGIGAEEDRKYAERILSYIKTKFCRVMLGVLKVTQDNNPEKWKYVPLQDFTDNSDIDWNVSISDIDKQLYKKYGLTREEIDFVETHVKEMA